MKLVLTCEHGGPLIPEKYKVYFIGSKDVLNTHRGFDLGALDVFNHLKPLADYSRFSKTSRLLIELNRSQHHKNLFSEVSRYFSKSEKSLLIEDYYSDYRNEVESKIKSFINAGEKVLHVSVHSFTPIYNNTERRCDIGLLYDSSNTSEKKTCKGLKSEIIKINPQLKVRFNYPYLGKSDGFTTYLRKQFPENYLGVELEINQKYAIDNKMPITLKQTIYQVLRQII
tara:strand:- start:3570 stop:4250 length:681 start_codon:yes stop_codon:yes gene_type:complete